MQINQSNKQYYIAFAIFSIVVLVATIVQINNSSLERKILREKSTIENLKQENEDLNQTRKTISDEVLKSSEENAVKSNKLTKSLSNEKPVIQDTTYHFMADFILRYSPN